MWEITCKNVTSTFPSASGHHLADISFLEFELLPLLISLNWFPIFSVESIFISHLLSGTSVHNCIYIPWLLACPRMPFVYRRHHWICLTHKATLVSAAGWDTGYLQEATAQGAGNAKLNPARGQPSSRERLPIQQRRHEARENRPVGKEPPPIVTGIVQVPYAPPTGTPCLRATFAAGALEGSDALHFARRVSMSLRFLLRTRRNRWDNGSSSGPGPVGQPSFGCCKVLEHSLYLLIDC